MSAFSPSLNANQQAAVAWDDGPALILAGPGSGKTAVLTLRAARILRARSEASVLALTFTNKAAAEMRDRLDALLGQRADRAHLCTFHSFATDVLRQHGSHIGLRPDFTLLTIDEDRVAVLSEALIGSRSDDEDELPDAKSILSLIDRLFADSYDGGSAAPNLAHTPAWLPVVFSKYCDALVAGNRLDFGALLHYTRRLLLTKKGVTQALQLAWTHFCVDEFQDTNKAQYDFLRVLVGDGKPNLFIVADDDQIIYQWNGASPERLHALQRDYSMQVIQLPQNYRCPPDIIGIANDLIRHSKSRTAGKAPLVASRPATGTASIYTYEFGDPDEEARGIAAQILARGLSQGDCVVLGRTTRLLQGVAAALKAAGLEAHIPQRKTAFEAGPIRWMFNILRLANARHNRDVLRRVCVAWQDSVDVLIEVDDVASASALIGGDFLRAWHAAAELDVADGRFRDFMAAIKKSLIERLDFLSLVERFFDEVPSGWKEDPLVADEIATWRELHDEVLREYGADDTTLNLYLQELDLRSKAKAPGAEAVRLLTIHGSKGLEFKHVFLMGMAEDVFPSFQAVKKGDESREMEEERRNCFVAITRTQETLTLTRSSTYYGYRKSPSRFLDEMGLASND